MINFIILTKVNDQGKVEEVLLFHGSAHESIEGIALNNFKLTSAPLTGERSKAMLFGTGLYFSELPYVSLVYGSGLVLCKVLTGDSRQYFPDGSTPPEIESDVDTRIVIKDGVRVRINQIY